jgi:hypothetical protein
MSEAVGITRRGGNLLEIIGTGRMRSTATARQTTAFWATMLIAAFALLTLAASSRASEGSAPKNPDIESGMTMRNEIVEYVIAEYGDRQGPMRIKFTHLVERYIKIGDDFGSAKELLLKNGFDVRDSREGKKYRESARYTPEGKVVRILIPKQYTYRIYGSYEMKYPTWTKSLYKLRYYDWWLHIYFGRSPESERIDEIFAVANLRAF